MSITELSAGKGPENDGEPRIDIIAVHGLNPFNSTNHSTRTWEAEDGYNWLRDKLPRDVPEGRILLYKYNSSPVFGLDEDRFIYNANILLECLEIVRGDDPKRPLIFIGHSLGGILIKQALVNAHNNSAYRDIKDSTRGLVFFGTPHAGPTRSSKIFFAKALVRIAQSLPGHSSNDIMSTLEKGSLFSDTLQEAWRQQLELYDIVSFYEGDQKIVPRDSAVIGLPGTRERQLKLNADHYNLCRFNLKDERDREDYFLVGGNLKRLCKIALPQGEPLQLSPIGIRLQEDNHNNQGDEILQERLNALRDS